MRVRWSSKPVVTAIAVVVLGSASACARARGPELADPVGVSTMRAAPIIQRDGAPSAAPNAAEPGRECVLPSFLFETGSATIDASQDAELQRIARCLTDGPLARSYVIAIGRADPVGGAAENMALGLERAAKIRQFLVARGVEERRVLATTTGERATAASVPGRRVDLVVVPSLPAPPRAE